MAGLAQLYQNAAGDPSGLDDGTVALLARRAHRTGQTDVLRRITMFRTTLDGDVRDTIRAAARNDRDVRDELYSRDDATIDDYTTAGGADDTELIDRACFYGPMLAATLAATHQSGPISLTLVANHRLSGADTVALVDVGDANTAAAWADVRTDDDHRGVVLASCARPADLIAAIAEASNATTSRDKREWCGPAVTAALRTRFRLDDPATYGDADTLELVSTMIGASTGESGNRWKDPLPDTWTGIDAALAAANTSAAAAVRDQLQQRYQSHGRPNTHIDRWNDTAWAARIAAADTTTAAELIRRATGEARNNDEPVTACIQAVWERDDFHLIAGVDELIRAASADDLAPIAAAETDVGRLINLCAWNGSAAPWQHSPIPRPVIVAELGDQPALAWLVDDILKADDSGTAELAAAPVGALDRHDGTILNRLVALLDARVDGDLDAALELFEGLAGDTECSIGELIERCQLLQQAAAPS